MFPQNFDKSYNFNYHKNPKESFRHHYCIINITCNRCGLFWRDRIWKHKLSGCRRCDNPSCKIKSHLRKLQHGSSIPKHHILKKKKVVFPQNIDELVNKFTLLNVYKIEDEFSKMSLPND